MSDLSLNQTSIAKQDLKETPAETGGIIANNSAPKLFTPAVETGGSIASNSGSSSGSSSGGVSFTC